MKKERIADKNKRGFDLEVATSQFGHLVVCGSDLGVRKALVSHTTLNGQTTRERMSDILCEWKIKKKWNDERMKRFC